MARPRKLKCPAKIPSLKLAPPRQAITVAFIGPTESDYEMRWKATCNAGYIIRYQDDDVDHVENAHRAAIALCVALEWDPRQLVPGGLPNEGGYVYTLRE